MDGTNVRLRHWEQEHWVTVVSMLVTIALCGSVLWLAPTASQLGALTSVLLVLGHAATVVAFPVPAWPAMVTATMLFGPWAGFGLSFAGLVGGSTAAFLLGRRFGPAWVNRWAGKYGHTLAGSDGWWLVPLLALPIPLGGDIGCFVAGVTRLRLRHFVLLACVGRLPGTTLGVLTATGIATGSATALVAALALVLILVLLARTWRSNRAEGATSAEPRRTAPHS